MKGHDQPVPMAPLRALQDWCRATCASYPGVEIRNMSTSFRDGLAFCAIIHKHRPDLIDFSSLSKDNVYQNNKVAFEVAESKLGIPALLDPKDMVSTKVPDCLGVITYLSQYYYFFNGKSCAGPARLWSPNVTVLNNLTKSKSDGLKRLKSLSDFESGREDRFSYTRPQTVCNLCSKPIHLIQRHLVDGKVYHRSCFRCKVCHSTLLPDSYTQGSDPGSLICTYHVTESKSTPVNLNQQIKSTDSFQACFYSLGGVAISSVPRYTKKTESQDRPVCKTGGTESQESSTENRDSTVGPLHPPLPSVKDRSIKEVEKDGNVQLDAAKTPEPSTPCAQVTEGSIRPVPAPRRTVDSSVVPVPAPRIKTSQTMNSFHTADSSSNQSKSPPSSSHFGSLTTSSPKVKTNHPWMAIVHPGPWTQLPPAPPPVPHPRSKPVSHMQGSCNQSKMPPPNPFEEDEDAPGEAVKPESADQTSPTVAAVHSENDGHTDAVVSAGQGKNPPVQSEESRVKPQDKPIPPKKPDFTERGGAAAADAAKGLDGVANTAQTCSEPTGDSGRINSSDLTDAAATGLCSTSDAAQTHILPRSTSVPAIASDHSHTPSVPLGLTREKESITSCPSKPACKENPFDRKSAMPKSKTFQDLSSSRGPAPGHGFPLIKRKVQTDQFVSTEDLQVQMSELDKHLEALEQRGVQLERNLRDCKNDKEEEQMLMEWFSLIHERHVLSRRDTELVYQTKQQKLEDRQADVEYELRCLLNKPESEWTQEDRGREQQLMEELVAIIEQRNQIISSLDQDRQREREEDMLWEGKMKNKDFQKEGLKEVKKSKGKFKPTKVLKLLNHKAEGTKESMDKKS